MQYEEFVSEVESALGDQPQRAGDDVVHVVLGTLGERLTQDQRSKLGAELPSELKKYLSRWKRSQHSWQRAQRFNREEFYDRIQARADVGFEEAVNLTASVMGVLRNAVSAGAINLVCDDLPSEIADVIKGTEQA